ncbi:pentatricopeptide repeat-containing protein At1g12300, mitochondrial-like [Aristolochia californica]|uniref:pentatricopeptide repeat-containing protein At1g12300, mitochondrial-like n=1 Tax=Aristolochia californica TaxID=171875 RepID=UPI0035DE992C
MEKLLQQKKYVAVCEHIIRYGSFVQDFIKFSLMIVNGCLLPYTMHIHNQMQILNVPTGLMTYTILLNAYCLAGSVRRAQDNYEAVKLVGACRYHVIPYNRIIKASVEATMWQFAREEMVSDGIRPNVVTWSSLISDFAKADLAECAIHTVDKMLLLGFEPLWRRYHTSNAYNPVHDVASSYRIGAATNVHVRLALGYKSVLISDADMNFKTTKAMRLIPTAVAVQDGLCTDGLIQGYTIFMAVVDGCYKALKFEDGKGVFRKMQIIGISSNVFSYTVFIHGLCQGKQLKDGIEFCIDM